MPLGLTVPKPVGEDSVLGHRWVDIIFTGHAGVDS